MSAPHPTRIVRLNLLAVLLGVSIPFAVDDLIKNYSIPMLLAEAAFLLTALNFFHGKVVTLEDEDYNDALTDRPILALMDYGLNLLVILCIVFMAFFLDHPGRLVIANLALRALDSILVLTVRSALPRDAIRKAQNTWLLINIGVIVSFLVLAWLYWPLHQHHLATAATFMFVILADILIDYSVNRKIYFSMADSWDEMADFWDALQGDEGDLYRKQIIIPAIKEVACLDPSHRVLDAGCGNGCLARVLVKSGAKVTAIDKSEKHLAVAKSYDCQGITYETVDLDIEEGPITGGPFDLAVACFTLQDCDSIHRPLKRIAANLSAKGRVIVIFENDYSFENTEEHSTTRRWLSPERARGNGRRQLIFWAPRAIRIAATSIGADELAREWTVGFKTVTRHWSMESYIEAAEDAGLRVILSTQELRFHEDLPTGKREPLSLAQYRRRPRFGMLIFEKTNPETSPPDPGGHGD